VNFARAAFVKGGEVSMSRRLFALSTLAVATLTASLAAQGGQTPAQSKPAPPPAAATSDVSVTVSYTGKGPVDPKHAIIVFLFTDPNIGPGSQPITGPQVATKNGATVKFTNVTAKQVYVAAVYNEKGNYDGVGGPPPAGTPIGMYQKDAKSPPAPVTPGPKTAVKMSFNDAKRFGG
jgi:hypothetical protein